MFRVPLWGCTLDDWGRVLDGSPIKGQLGVPLTVYPWYLLCSPGILGDYNLAKGFPIGVTRW